MGRIEAACVGVRRRDGGMTPLSAHFGARRAVYSRGCAARYLRRPRATSIEVGGNGLDALLRGCLLDGALADCQAGADGGQGGLVISCAGGRCGELGELFQLRVGQVAVDV